MKALPAHWLTLQFAQQTKTRPEPGQPRAARSQRVCGKGPGTSRRAASGPSRLQRQRFASSGACPWGVRRGRGLALPVEEHPPSPAPWGEAGPPGPEFHAGTAGPRGGEGKGAVRARWPGLRLRTERGELRVLVLPLLRGEVRLAGPRQVT